MRHALLFACLLAVAHAGVARANGRFPQSNQVAFHPHDPLTIVARTTFGLLVTHDGGAHWSWVCEGSLDLRPTEDPPVGIVGDGHILLSTFTGQKLGTPDACDFPYAAPDFVHVVAIDNCVDPSSVDAAYVVTSQGGRPNQPWHTTDDGAHWTALGAPIPDVLFETIDVGRADPMRVYMTGALPPTSTTPRIPYVYRSTNGGTDFTRYEFALGPGDTNVFLAAVDPANSDRIFVRVSGDHRTTPISPDRLVVSTDGGQTFHDVIDLVDMFGFAQSDDGTTVWVGSPSMGVFRSDDRGEHFANVNASLQVNCLAARGSELWVCANDFADGFALGVSHDGGMTYEGKLRLGAISGAVSCPAGTSSAPCACGWCTLEAMFDPMGTCTPPAACTADGGVTDAAVPDGGGLDAGAGIDAGSGTGGKGCCSAAGARGGGLPALAVLGLTLALGWRRRRRVLY